MTKLEINRLFHLWYRMFIKLWWTKVGELIEVLSFCVVCLFVYHWHMFWLLWLFHRNLPRHQFGNLQSKMFPAYFSLVGVSCAVSVASFTYLHPWKSSSTTEKYQLGFLLSAFAFNLSNLFVFTPMTIEVRTLQFSVSTFKNILVFLNYHLVLKFRIPRCQDLDMKRLDFLIKLSGLNSQYHIRPKNMLGPWVLW